MPSCNCRGGPTCCRNAWYPPAIPPCSPWYGVGEELAERALTRLSSGLRHFMLSRDDAQEPAPC